MADADVRDEGRVESLKAIVGSMVRSLAESDTKYLRYVASSVGAEVESDAEPDVLLTGINETLMAADDTDMVMSLANEVLDAKHEYLGDSLVRVTDATWPTP